MKPNQLLKYAAFPGQNIIRPNLASTLAVLSRRNVVLQNTPFSRSPPPPKEPPIVINLLRIKLLHNKHKHKHGTNVEGKT